MIRLTESARALLAVLSIFVIGFVVGCGVDRAILAPPREAAAASVMRYAPRHHEEVLAELRTELGLSAEQTARVQAIFTAHQSQIEATWAKIHADVRHAMGQTTKEIEAVLDSAQVERLHAWMARRHGPGGHAPGREH